MRCDHAGVVPQWQAWLLTAVDAGMSLMVATVCPACGSDCWLRLMMADDRWVVSSADDAVGCPIAPWICVDGMFVPGARLIGAPDDRRHPWGNGHVPAAM